MLHTPSTPIEIPFAHHIPSPINLKTKTASMAIRASKGLLEGRVLVLDPSIGSKPSSRGDLGSQPGYAIFVAGHLTEYGVVDLPTLGTKHQRLRRLLLAIQTGFHGVWDVLVIEDIPPVIGRGRGRMAGFNGSLSLHHAVGVTMAAVDAKSYVKVSIATWHAWTSPEYAKRDDHDAVAIGLAAVGIARAARERGIRTRAKDAARKTKVAEKAQRTAARRARSKR